jgi:hypothetical protein
MAKQGGGERPKPVRWIGSSKEDLSEFPKRYEGESVSHYGRRRSAARRLTRSR